MHKSYVHIRLKHCLFTAQLWLIHPSVLQDSAFAGRLSSYLFCHLPQTQWVSLRARVHVCIHISFSQHCVTSIDALSSPGKRAREWEINCQTMHGSHPLWFSSCQMISKHYRMSGCIIYCTSSPPTPTAAAAAAPHPHGFVGLSQKVPFNGRTTFIIIIIILFSTHSPQLMKTCSISVGLYDINIREMSE